MIKAVVDTNGFVSGTIKKDSNPGKVLKAWREGRFILVSSKPIVFEIERVFKYPRIKEKYNLTEKDVRDVITNINTDAIVTPGKLKISGISRDPDDRKFITCAIEGRANYIITGDNDLLTIKKHKRIDFVTPKEFLAILRKS